jgi:hypothetical protein
MKKIFEEGIIVSILMVALISVIQILIFKNEKYSLAWHDNMFRIGWILIMIFPLLYFMFIRKDRSEALGLFLTSLILWFSGLTDLLYFWLRFQNLPFTLPWLNNHFIIGRIKDMLGLPVVTSTLLLISVCVGFIIVLIIDIWLEKVN